MIKSHEDFSLQTPVPLNGETVSSITLRRPKGLEVRQMRNAASLGTKGSGDLTTGLMAALSEREEALFDAMDVADYRTIEKWLEKFLGN
jgi:hypothetical protein